MKEKYIIKPFNKVFNITFLVYVMLLSAFIFLLRGRDLNIRKWGIVAFYLADLLLFIWYKFQISIDEEYGEIFYKEHGFNWFNELPFNTCNTVLFLVPLGVLTGNRMLLATCFFSSIIVTPLALVMPCRGFSDFPFFKPRVFGFYTTHYMTLSAGLLYGFLGIYKPVYSDLKLIFAGMLLLLTIAYLINKAMRISGVNPYANYFYCVHPDGNPALELFKKAIPFEYFYCVPLVFIFVILASVLIFAIGLFA